MHIYAPPMCCVISTAIDNIDTDRELLIGYLDNEEEEEPGQDEASGWQEECDQKQEHSSKPSKNFLEDWDWLWEWLLQ